MGEHILTVPPLSPHTLLTFTGIVLVFYLDTLTSSRAVQGLLWSLINLLLLLLQEHEQLSTKLQGNEQHKQQTRHGCAPARGGAAYVNALPSSAPTPMRSASALARPDPQATRPAPWPRCAQPSTLTGR